MFGEKPIDGEKEIKIDSKHRITVPAYTYAESNDIIYPRFGIPGNVLLLLTEEEYHIRKDNFENFLKEQRSLGKMSYHDLLRYRRYYYGSLSFMPETLDKQRRFVLEERIIRKLELTDHVLTIGEDTHLVLCKDRPTYEQYIEKEGQKRVKV